jgi:hypothetical protein
MIFMNIYKKMLFGHLFYIDNLNYLTKTNFDYK